MEEFMFVSQQLEVCNFMFNMRAPGVNKPFKASTLVT